jgi:hypothetical protein
LEAEGKVVKLLMPLYESLRRMNSLIQVRLQTTENLCNFGKRALAEDPLRESEIAETIFAINCWQPLVDRSSVCPVDSSRVMMVQAYDPLPNAMTRWFQPRNFCKIPKRKYEQQQHLILRMCGARLFRFSSRIARPRRRRQTVRVRVSVAEQRSNVFDAERNDSEHVRAAWLGGNGTGANLGQRKDANTWSCFRVLTPSKFA